jgi:hypothetical protein
MAWKRARYPECRFMFVNAGSTYFLLHREHAASVGEVESGWERVRRTVADTRVDALLFVHLTSELRGIPVEGARAPANVESRLVWEGAAGTWTRVRVSTLEHPELPLGLRPPAACVPPAASRPDPASVSFLRTE